MLAAYDSDMTSGDYVYIELTLLPSERVLTPWIRHDSRDEDAMKAYQPLLEVLFVHKIIMQIVLSYRINFVSVSLSLCFVT